MKGLNQFHCVFLITYVDIHSILSKSICVIKPAYLELQFAIERAITKLNNLFLVHRYCQLSLTMTQIFIDKSSFRY